MNSEDLKKIAEYMRPEAANIRVDELNIVWVFGWKKDSQNFPIRNKEEYNPLQNNNQLVELIEKLLSNDWEIFTDNGYFFLQHMTKNGNADKAIHDETLAEAVCNAVLEIVK